MSRYPVFIGGNVTSHDKYMVKLMTTSTAKHPNLDQTILTAPVTQPPRGLSKSKAQEKADRLAQRANATEDDGMFHFVFTAVG
jgi:tRNA G10  N-methylase Trm11